MQRGALVLAEQAGGARLHRVECQGRRLVKGDAPLRPAGPAVARPAILRRRGLNRQRPTRGLALAGAGPLSHAAHPPRFQDLYRS